MDGETLEQQAVGVGGLNPFSSITPLLASVPGAMESSEKMESKLSRHLVVKGLPTRIRSGAWSMWTWRNSPNPHLLWWEEQG